MTSELRTRTIQMAVTMFRASGYAAVGVTEICRAVGVSRAHFYRMFDSKRALGLEAIAVFAEERDTMAARALRAELPIRGQVQRMFSMLHAEQVASLERTGLVAGSPLALFGDDDPDDGAALRVAIDGAHARWRDRLRLALAGADQRGELRLPDAGYAAEAIVALAEGALALARVANNPRIVLDLAPAAMSLMIDRKATGSWPLILLSSGSFQAV